MTGRVGGYGRGVFVAVTCFLIVVTLALSPERAWGADASPVAESARIEKLDKAVKGLMKKYGIPGGTIAVMKDGRLVYAKGYGFADKGAGQKAKPDTLFRIASVSKTITAVATLMCVQDGTIRLDDKAFSILDDYHAPAGSTPDPRLALITVRDLLRHSGGWVTSEAGDPQYMCLEIAAATGCPSPPSPQAIIRYWMGQPLQVDPGTLYSYSNFGYNVLGRILEKESGQSYESHVLSRILFPAGIRRMQIGHSLKEQRALGEGTYYPAPGAPLMDSAFPALGQVPQAYGGWSHEALDAHGGWIASAVDLMRFVRVVEGSGGQPKLLSDETLATMTQYQGLPGQGQSPTHYYGLGWVVDFPGTPQEEWSHTGALENCNASLLTRRADGLSYAVLFNTLPPDFQGFFEEFTPVMRTAVDSVKKWPDKDLFSKYP